MKTIFKTTIIGSVISNDKIECTGPQLSFILNEIKDLTQAYCWYVVDVLAPGQKVIELFGESKGKQIPLKVGSTEDLIMFVSPISQFERGLFLAVTEKNAVSWSLDEFDTEDSDEIEPAILTIRAFDTSYFEIASKENTIIQRLVDRFAKVTKFKRR